MIRRVQLHRLRAGREVPKHVFGDPNPPGVVAHAVRSSLEWCAARASRRARAAARTARGADAAADSMTPMASGLPMLRQRVDGQPVQVPHAERRPETAALQHRGERVDAGPAADRAEAFDGPLVHGPHRAAAGRVDGQVRQHLLRVFVGQRPEDAQDRGARALRAALQGADERVVGRVDAERRDGPGRLALHVRLGVIEQRFQLGQRLLPAEFPQQQDRRAPDGGVRGLAQALDRLAPGGPEAGQDVDEVSPRPIPFLPRQHFGERADRDRAQGDAEPPGRLDDPRVGRVEVRRHVPHRRRREEVVQRLRRFRADLGLAMTLGLRAQRLGQQRGGREVADDEEQADAFEHEAGEVPPQRQVLLEVHEIGDEFRVEQPHALVVDRAAPGGR